MHAEGCDSQFKMLGKVSKTIVESWEKSNTRKPITIGSPRNNSPNDFILMRQENILY